MIVDSAQKNVKPVIVVVDIDDDLGEVLGKSLIVGEENIRSAVLEFGLKRPYDPDVNALLAGLSLYEKFRANGDNPLIVAVGGHHLDYLEAQKNIKRRVESAVNDLDAIPEFYIVSDGEDEFVISQLLSDLGRIGGFHRVIVEQDLGIEGRYLLVLKYIKKAMFDKRFSRYALGIPGIAVVVFALLSLKGLVSLALKATALVIGIAMVIRGFDLEKAIEDSLSSFMRGIREKPYINISGLTILFLSLFVSIYTMYQASVTPNADLTLKVAKVFQTSLPILAAGTASYIIISKIFHKLAYEDSISMILKDVSALVVVIFLGIAFYNLGTYLIGNASSTITVSMFLDSGFIQFIVAGAGIAAIIEMVIIMALAASQGSRTFPSI
jgi:putative membrane protein